MKALLLAVLLCGSLLLAGDPNANADVSVRAISLKSVGHVHQLRGDAVLETSAVAVHADEIDYNQDTNEISARGNVRIKLRGQPSYLFVGAEPGQTRERKRGLPMPEVMPPEIIK